jgi:hypothetical protein
MIETLENVLSALIEDQVIRAPVIGNKRHLIARVDALAEALLAAAQFFDNSLVIQGRNPCLSNIYRKCLILRIRYC